MNPREIRGMQIAKMGGIKPIHNGWLVPSQTTEKLYKVTKDFVCNCPDHEHRGIMCKHCYAVQFLGS